MGQKAAGQLAEVALPAGLRPASFTCSRGLEEANMYRLTLSFLVASVLAGCCSSRSMPAPGAISLEDAMKSVGTGLVAMHAAEGGLKTGLVPSEVTVTFNISASATDASKLVVEVGAPVSVPVTGKVGGEVSSTSTMTRGNQIRVFRLFSG